MNEPTVTLHFDSLSKVQEALSAVELLGFEYVLNGRQYQSWDLILYPVMDMDDESEESAK